LYNVWRQGIDMIHVCVWEVGLSNYFKSPKVSKKHHDENFVRLNFGRGVLGRGGTDVGSFQEFAEGGQTGTY